MAFVIKVEYEGSLRRLLASRSEKEDLSLDKLEARIRDLFKIPRTAQLKITYKDKENDVITVGNDQDLTAACVTQKIDPLYIRVTVVTKAAEEQNSPVTSERVNVSSTPEPVKDSNNYEKSMKKKVKIVDPVFQRFMPPNQLPQMLQNIAKMMTPVAKKVEATPEPISSELSKSEDSIATAALPNDPIKEDKKTREETESSDQATHKSVCCNVCQINPIVGPRFKSVKC